MPYIHIPQKNKSIYVREGANLMKSLKDAGYPVASSCGGDGICGKCRITISKGAENLNRISPLELETQKRNDYTDNQRASCLTRVNDDIEIFVSYW